MDERKLQQLDDQYKSRKEEDCYYKLIVDSKEGKDAKGTYMVATRDINKFEVILVEDPLDRIPADPSPALLQSPELQHIFRTLQECQKTHGHLPGADMHPPQARRCTNRMSELQIQDYMSRFTPPRRSLVEIWKLQDSHRCAETGDLVMIDGLKSESGKLLNGKQGRVIGIDDKSKERLAVEVFIGNSTTSQQSKGEKKSLKPENLKSLGGISRTNAFLNCHGTSMLLFKDLSRVNHACGTFCNAGQWCSANNDKTYLIATKDIKRGDEILIDYIPGESAELMLGLIHMKYNFWCKCPSHDL